EDRFDFLNFDPAIAFLHSPILIVITGLASVYGIMTSFGRRLRWNSEGIDYRDMFFESRFVRWDEIDRIDLCAAVFTDEIILKNRPRLVFAKVAGRAGLDLLEADARVNGVEFVATKGGSNLWRRWLGQADQGSEIKKKETEPRHQSDWQDPDDAPDLSTPEWQAIIDKVPVTRGGVAKAPKATQTDEKGPKPLDDPRLPS
ncbi:MAG: hypothetical protein EBT35_10775, partial [Alphaproteobacteria bacterium]|nr:hypothetical protein [Alphaproteobacteria bacterium]